MENIDGDSGHSGPEIAQTTRLTKLDKEKLRNLSGFGWMALGLGLAQHGPPEDLVPLALAFVPTSFTDPRPLYVGGRDVSYLLEPVELLRLVASVRNDRWAIPPPCHHPPGTVGRLRAYAARALFGHAIFQAGDAEQLSKSRECYLSTVFSRGLAVVKTKQRATN